MKDYTKMLPKHMEKIIGVNDLFLEAYEGDEASIVANKRPPLLFVHGAYTGSWMWSKYIPHFISKGWKCFVMNLRSHYKSRVMDMTKITFEDYMEDILEVIEECGEIPIIIGFSLGGILCQKLAESIQFPGMILIDSSISKEVNEIVPYEDLQDSQYELIAPAPERQEISSIDESEEDIIFQKKYLSMESSIALNTCACWVKGNNGLSVDYNRINCPILVIKSIHSEADNRRGEVEAKLCNAEYTGYWNTTHTGLLIGQRYIEIVNSILEWLDKRH